MKGRLWIATRSLTAHIPGGMERVAEETSAGLARRGWLIDLVTTRLDGDAALPSGVRVHALDAPPGMHSARFRRALAKWAAGRERPDLLLSISFAGGEIMRRRPEIPSICQAHGSAWREAAGKLRRMDPRGLYRLALHLAAERPAFARADRIVAVGPAVRDYLTSFPYGFLDPAKIVVVPNGIDADACARAAGEDRSAVRGRFGIAGAEKLVVAACRLLPEKGVFDLVRAYETIEGRERAALVLAGSGRDENRIRGYCRARGLERVKLVGSLPHADALGLLRAADLVAQVGTRPEGLPLVVLEAIAVGTPALVSAGLSLPDLGAAADSVVRADPRSPASIAAGIESGLRIGPLSPETARAARERFSLETTLDRYEHLIKETIRN